MKENEQLPCTDAFTTRHISCRSLPLYRVLRMSSFNIRFTLKQLRYFFITAQALSFTAAAKTLHISQPSISSAIADLEEKLGISLFIRCHATGLHLTAEGKALLEKSKALLQNAEALQLFACDLSIKERGQINLGFLISMAPSVQPSLIKHFRQHYEAITLSAVECDQLRLIEALIAGRIDAALTYDLNLPDEIAFLPLTRLEPYAILPPHHRLASREHVSLYELANEPYIMLDLPHSREYFCSLFSDHGLAPLIAYQSSQPEIVRGMVANGLGFSILNYPLHSNTTVDGEKFLIKKIQEDLRPLFLGAARMHSNHSRKILHIFEEFSKNFFDKFTNEVR